MQRHEAYRTGELGWKRTAALHEVEASSLRKWTAAFDVHGAEGLRNKRKEVYGIEFRLQVLQRPPSLHHNSKTTTLPVSN